MTIEISHKTNCESSFHGEMDNRQLLFLRKKTVSQHFLGNTTGYRNFSGKQPSIDIAEVKLNDD